MDRLSKPDIDELKLALVTWHAPEAMLALLKPVSSVVYFNQAGLAFLRDGWIAGSFAAARKADRVRLVSDQWPDFEIAFGDVVETFEAVEADDPNRRRGLEYTDEAIGRVEHDPVENWVARAEAAPKWIRRVCSLKAKKQYAERTNLVIYLNMSEYGIRQKETENSFYEATKPAHDIFDSVWILWNSQAYKVV